MALRIQSVSAYAPKLVLDRTADMKELVPHIAARTSANDSGVSEILKEMRDAIITFALAGRAVKFEGVGTFKPKINLKGEIKLTFIPESEVKARLNTPRAFLGVIRNKDNRGKSSDELVAIWNEEHPDDPIAT